MKNKRSIIYVGIAFAVLVLVLAACGSNQDASPAQWAARYSGRVAEPATAAPDAAPPGATPPPVQAAPPVVGDMLMGWAGDGDTAGSAQVEWEDVAGTQERHIIQTANVELETEDFDEVVSELRQLAPAADGYVESEMLSQHGRRLFTIVLRIPAARFETILRHVESLADVRVSTQRAEDVTDRFYDIVGNLETRRIEEDRILALIDVAENISELLALEARLSNTRLSIQQYEAQLNNLAGLIAYSTITVTLHDTYEEEIIIAAPTLGERIGGAFGDSVDGTVNALQGFVVFLAGAAIPLAIFGVIVFIVYKIVRIVIRRMKPSGA